MAFNYAHEKAKFDAAWKKTAAWYRAEGMSEEAIRILHDDAWEEFKADRNYILHTQDLPSDSGINTVYYWSLMITFSEEDFTERYAWIETIDNPRLVQKLRQLDPHGLEMLTLITQDGMTQEEAAQQMGIPYRTFKYQWSRLKKYLKNF